MRMNAIVRGAIGVAAVGGVIAATPLPAVASASTAASISIAATTKSKPITRDVVVFFRSGVYSNARISGTITNGTSGDVAKLLVQQFPFKKAPVAAGTVTLTGTSAPYSFAEVPKLETRYQVKLYASATSTTAIASSKTVTVYLLASHLYGGLTTCRRPVCHESIAWTTYVPASAMRAEMAKRAFGYFGIRFSSTGIPLPAWLYRSAGGARLTAPRRVAGDAFKRTIKLTFTIGNRGYHWVVFGCTKDSVTKDGVGLPGSHQCGYRRIRITSQYVG